MKYLSHYVQDAQTELLNKLGAFFAFSQKQFDEQKKEGVVYISVSGLGVIAPKDNAQELVDGLGNIHKLGIQQDIAENGIENIIKRELNNHEAYYTWSINDTVDALSAYGITREQVREIFNQEKVTHQFL